MLPGLFPSRDDERPPAKHCLTTNVCTASPIVKTYRDVPLPEFKGAAELSDVFHAAKYLYRRERANFGATSSSYTQ